MPHALVLRSIFSFPFQSIPKLLSTDSEYVLAGVYLWASPWAVFGEQVTGFGANVTWVQIPAMEPAFFISIMGIMILTSTGCWADSNAAEALSLVQSGPLTNGCYCPCYC